MARNDLKERPSAQAGDDGWFDRLRTIGNGDSSTTLSEEEKQSFKDIQDNYDQEAVSRNAGSNQNNIRSLENNAGVDDGQQTEASTKEKDRLKKPQDLADSKSLWRSDVRRAKSKRYINKKKKAVVGAIVSALAASAIGGFLLLPNLALKAMTEKTSQFFYSSVQTITERRLGKYFNGYATKIIIPSIDACGTTISIECDVIDPGEGRVASVYKAWRDNRIEESLFDNHGISIEKRAGSKEANYFRTDSFGNKTLLGTSGEKTLVKEVLDAMNTETQSTKIMERWKVRGLLARKYSANKWCIIACKTRDSADAKFANAKQKLKVKLALRTAAVANEKAAIYVLCFAIGCSDDDLNKAGNEAVQKYLGENADDLLKEVSDDIGGRKTGKYFSDQLIEKILIQFVSKESAKKAASAVPVAGQVYLAATMAEALATIDDKITDGEISEYLYGINEEALVQNYAAWQSIGDAVISNEASVSDTGAAFSIAAGYDQSRVWQTINGREVLSDVTCSDGTVLSDGDPLTCPDKQLNNQVAIERWRNEPLIGTAVSLQLDNYRCPAELITIGIDVPPGGCFLAPRTVVRPLLNGIDFVIGAAGGALIDQVSSIPGIGTAMGFLQDKSTEFISYVAKITAEALITPYVNPEAEDIDNYDQYAASADLTSNAFLGGGAEDGGLGGRALTQVEDEELQAHYFEELRLERQNQSVFTRYFDINNPDSLLTTVALQTPTLFESANPLDLLEAPQTSVASIGKILGGNAYAANTLEPEARQEIFGITQFGYSLNDPQLDLEIEYLEDPDVCEAFALAREESAIEDPITGQTIYTKADPCVTEAQVVDVITKKYNLDESRAASFEGSVDLDEFLENKRQDTTQIPCDPTGLIDSSFEPAGSGANEIEINLCDYGNVRVNSAWSTAVVQLLAAAESDGIEIKGSGYRSSQRQIELRKANCPNWSTSSPSECSPPTARPGTSNHEYGLAIDVSEIFNECGKDASVCPSNGVFRWLTENASRFGISKLESEAWHWSIDGG